MESFVQNAASFSLKYLSQNRCYWPPCSPLWCSQPTRFFNLYENIFRHCCPCQFKVQIKTGINHNKAAEQRLFCCRWDPVCTVVKSKVKISQNFVAFSEYMNFRR